MNGVIFDIKRFAVHDGGGIRSTLFLKGCPMRCPWCQNPEGLEQTIRLWHRSALCIACGACARACPMQALALTCEKITIDHSRCNGCGACVEVCPAAAMEFDGRRISSLEAAELLLRDRVFFGQKGGVTLSGGEALMQPEFAREVLCLCKEAGVDTALETCLFAPREVIEAMLPVVDHFLIDIKYLDNHMHRAVLGVSNPLVLENYKFLVACGADVLVRTPLIPGYTATEENLRAIAAFVHGVNPMQAVELLNFNPLCRSKYTAQGRAYPISGQSFSDTELAGFARTMGDGGVSNLIKE